VAAVLYSNFLIAYVLQGFGDTATVVSQLEVPGQPDAALLRVTDALSALLVLPLLPGLPRALPAGGPRSIAHGGSWVFAIGALVAATVALPCGPGVPCSAPGQVIRTAVHDGSTLVSDVAAFAGIAATWWVLRHRRPGLARLLWWLFWIGGVVAVAVLAYAEVQDSTRWLLGVAQRVHILCISIWICCLGLLATRPSADSVLPPASEGEQA
jgi:Protein of unknown function (DUF998)